LTYHGLGFRCREGTVEDAENGGLQPPNGPDVSYRQYQAADWERRVAEGIVLSHEAVPQHRRFAERRAGPATAGAKLLGIVTVRGAAPQWVEIDVTAFLKAEQLAGRQFVSVALRTLEHTSAFASFDSREDGASGPQLVIAP